MLASAYAEAKKLSGGVFKFESPVDMRAGVGSQGRTQFSLLLPNNQPISAITGLGLPSPCTEPKLLSMQYDPEGKGYWIEISAKDKREINRTSFVLLSEDKDGQEAVLLKLRPANKALYDAYRATKRLPGEKVQINQEADPTEVIQVSGTAQQTFLLPGLKAIGPVDVGLGLPYPCTKPKLLSMQYDPEGKGYWLEISAKDKHNTTQTSFVLLSEENDGREAVLLRLYPANKALYDAYRAAKRVPGEKVQINQEADLTEVIQVSGNPQRTFLLPLLEAIDVLGIGLGLPKHCTEPKLLSMQYDPKGKGYWLEISAKDKHNTTQTSFVLLSEDKDGREAVLLKLFPANKALYDAYRAAKRVPGEKVQINQEADPTEVIGVSGSPQRTFLLPGLKAIGPVVGLGLANPCTEPKLLTMQYDPENKGYWIELEAKDGDLKLKRSLVLLSDDQTKEGRDAVLQVFNPNQLGLWELYRHHEADKLPSEILEMIGSENCAKKSWPLPNGKSLPKLKRISLHRYQKLTSFLVTQVQPLSNDRFIFFTTAKYENGSTQHVRLLISNSGIEAIGSAEKDSAQICKGFALDRFVAHIAAVGALPKAVTNPVHFGSALTGDVHIPNMQALDTVMHSKWGNNPVEVFSYILQYGRMMRLNNLPVGCFLIADDTHHEALRDALTAACQELKFNAGITTVHQWAERVAGKDLKVTEELNVLQALADAGLEEDLKSRTYSPTIPSAAQFTPNQDDWKARVKSFADPEAVDALLETLNRDLSVHSLFWEEQYHLTLAKHLSFLLEETEHHPQRTEIEALVYQFYPELEQYPGAWRALDSEAAAQMPKRQSLTLSKFDLPETLAALKAPKRQAAQPDEPAIGTGKVMEIPELREFCHKGNAVTKDSLTALISEAEELKTKYPENTSLLGDTCLAAFCKIAGLDQRLWQASQTLADIKSGAISPSQDIIPALSSELKSFRLTVAQLARISKIYS